MDEAKLKEALQTIIDTMNRLTNIVEDQEKRIKALEGNDVMNKFESISE